MTSALPEFPAAPVRSYSLRERVFLSLISGIGYMAIRMVGPTLRLAVSLEEGGRAHEPQHPSIFAFWHRCVFPAVYCFRNHRIAVMTSRSFDGEYIARIIERAGYIAVRGSSSAGGQTALRAMHRLLEVGTSAAFTIDGPRGPRYVAKPGAVLLARNSGAPIVAFHIALRDAWVLPSWDQMMIPEPFARGVLRISRPLWIPADAREDELQAALAELQRRLDGCREVAESLLRSGQYLRLPEHRWSRRTSKQPPPI